MSEDKKSSGESGQSNSNSNSNKKRSPSGNRNKNRRRKTGNGPKNNSPQSGNNKKPNSGGSRSNPQSRNSQGNKKKRRRRKKPSENLSPLEKLFRKYENLQEQHLVARKKYFELFHRADPRQKTKLEFNFTKTIKEVRDFEASLKGDDKENFMKKYHGLVLDTEYTAARDMSIEGEEVPFEGNFDDPHYLPSQSESSFQTDTEESSGAMEDYLKYKGLS